MMKICKTDDMQNEEVRAFQIGDRQIALCHIEDKFYAFDEICSHQYASLEEGWLEDFAIECPLHGAQFDIRTGEALTLPAVEDIKTYPVKIEGNYVFIKLD